MIKCLCITQKEMPIFDYKPVTLLLDNNEIICVNEYIAKEVVRKYEEAMNKDAPDDEVFELIDGTDYMIVDCTVHFDSDKVIKEIL